MIVTIIYALSVILQGFGLFLAVLSVTIFKGEKARVYLLVFFLSGISLVGLGWVMSFVKLL